MWFLGYDDVEYSLVEDNDVWEPHWSQQIKIKWWVENAFLLGGPWNLALVDWTTKQDDETMIQDRWNNSIANYAALFGGGWLLGSEKENRLYGCSLEEKKSRQNLNFCVSIQYDKKKRASTCNSKSQNVDSNTIVGPVSYTHLTLPTILLV